MQGWVQQPSISLEAGPRNDFYPFVPPHPPVAPRATLAIVKRTQIRARYAATCICVSERVRSYMRRCCIRGVHVRVTYATHQYTRVLSGHVREPHANDASITFSHRPPSLRLFRSLSFSAPLYPYTILYDLTFSVSLPSSFSLDLSAFLSFALFPIAAALLCSALFCSALLCSALVCYAVLFLWLSLSRVLVPRKRGSSFSFSFETCQRPPGHALHPRRSPLIHLRPPPPPPALRPSRTILTQPPLFLYLPFYYAASVPAWLDRSARFFALSRFCKNMRTLIRWANSSSAVVLSYVSHSRNPSSPSRHAEPHQAELHHAACTALPSTRTPLLFRSLSLSVLDSH